MSSVSGAIASFNYVELPARCINDGISGADLFHTPTAFGCIVVGSLCIPLRSDHKMFIVFKDIVGSQVFFWTGYSTDLPKLRLKSCAHEYGTFGNALYEITKENARQVCYFCMGWGVEYNYPYNREERHALVNAIMQALDMTEI